MAAFPPLSPSVQTHTIPSYLYTQYNDDDDIQAFVNAYNGMAQTYVDWFVNVGLPVYTQLSGSLLDWVAQGLYGIVRPVLSSSSSGGFGPVNTYLVNSEIINSSKAPIAGSYYTADDDTFQRIITWHFFKADGKVFTLPWLKRRVLRFLYGTNGTAPNVSYTGEVSITISTYTVTIDLTAITGVTTQILQSFQYAVAGKILELPPQFEYTVTL